MAPDREITILLAEDEEVLRTPLLALLKRGGYNVIVAVDGFDALAKGKAHQGTIHLLLSDILMSPGMTGIEVATQLLIERPGMGILLMSAASDGILPSDHGWQFLSKPFKFQSLKLKIESILNDKSEHRRDPADFGNPAK
jgi:two-component system, cell cycle sensor histidine kinase and response regulator CckA